MSGPSLVERARSAAPDAANGAFLRELADRIAELEAERDQARECLDLQRDNYAVLLVERDALRTQVSRLALRFCEMEIRFLLSEGGG